MTLRRPWFAGLAKRMPGELVGHFGTPGRIIVVLDPPGLYVPTDNGVEKVVGLEGTTRGEGGS